VKFNKIRTYLIIKRESQYPVKNRYIVCVCI